ncbi:MAG: flagellar basal body-associated FliL family protein [Armatimonadetes bacterium]|nr:flagellar basal body-associated FliL family protein [Armatimonadota bacterium]
MADVPAEGTEAAPPAPKGKKSPLLAALISAVLVGPLAIGAYTLVAKPKATDSEESKTAKDKEVEDEEAEEVEHGELVTLPLATQTVNLADGDRYVRCGMELAFELEEADAEYFRAHRADMTGETEEKPAEGEGHGEKKGKPKEPSKRVQRLVHLLTSHRAEFADTTINELGARKYDQMLKLTERAALKKVLMEHFNQMLTESKLTVHDIYFSEFVMQ